MSSEKNLCCPTSRNRNVKNAPEFVRHGFCKGPSDECFLWRRQSDIIVAKPRFRGLTYALLWSVESGAPALWPYRDNPALKMTVPVKRVGLRREPDI